MKLQNFVIWVLGFDYTFIRHPNPVRSFVWNAIYTVCSPIPNFVHNAEAHFLSLLSCFVIGYCFGGRDDRMVNLVILEIISLLEREARFAVTSNLIVLINWQSLLSLELLLMISDCYSLAEQSNHSCHNHKPEKIHHNIESKVPIVNSSSMSPCFAWRLNVSKCSLDRKFANTHSVVRALFETTVCLL